MPSVLRQREPADRVHLGPDKRLPLPQHGGALESHADGLDVCDRCLCLLRGEVLRAGYGRSQLMTVSDWSVCRGEKGGRITGYPSSEPNESLLKVKLGANSFSPSAVMLPVFMMMARYDLTMSLA